MVSSSPHSNGKRRMSSIRQRLRCWDNSRYPHVTIVWGKPDEISRCLIESPIVRKVSFTGSVPVGNQLVALAGALQSVQCRSGVHLAAAGQRTARRVHGAVCRGCAASRRRDCHWCDVAGSGGWFFTPTVEIGLPDHALLMTDEPFSPIAPIVRFGTLEFDGYLVTKYVTQV